MTKCIRDKSKSVCLCCELNSFFMRNLRKKLTWWTCHEVVNLNPALKNKVSFVCDDTCGTPGLGRGEYSSNIRVKESRWGFETLTQFRTTKTLKYIRCLGQTPKWRQQYSVYHRNRPARNYIPCLRKSEQKPTTISFICMTITKYYSIAKATWIYIPDSFLN